MVDRISMHRSLGFLALGICLVSLAPSARAADPSAMTRAARLTFMQGNVTIAGSENAASVPAQINLPLLSGVQLTTGSDGQAEVEFEDGSVVRLTPNSALSLDSLTVQSDGVFLSNLTLLRGLAYCELRATAQYRYTLNVGGDVMSPIENTTVRVNFDDPPAIFSVLDGTALVERQGGAPNTEGAPTGYQTQVRAGETLRADRSDTSRYFLSQEIAEDSWDQWNEDRDQAASSQAEDSTAVRNDYAGAQGYGWSDLDANGSWYDVPGQGQVWQPQVAVDDVSFDPYGSGAWVFYPNTGYVWASSYSWGWTPYRCGNWSYYNSFGWGWAPGAGCGGHGWGFAGGGRPVNIVTSPTNYRPIRVPLRSGPGRLQPTLPIQIQAWHRQQPTHDGLTDAGRKGDLTDVRRIAGVPVVPIKPVGSGPIGEGNHPSSSLRRDYPIDSVTRTPALGLASTSPTVLHTNSGPGSNDARPGHSDDPAEARRPQSPYAPGNARSYPTGGLYRGAQPAHPAPPSGQVQRPAQPYAPAGFGSPQSPPPPAPSNRPSPHPTYAPPPPAPPPATHPTSAAPPSPVSHPTSSAPPPAVSHPQTPGPGRFRPSNPPA